MVTTFTYLTYGEDRCTQFRVIVVTDTHLQTHKHTDRTDYNTLRRSVISKIRPQRFQLSRGQTDKRKT